MKRPCPRNPGYTLIELLVVVAIIGILFVLSLTYYNQFNRRQIVDQSAAQLKNEMRLAQSKAIAGEKPPGCAGLTLSGHKLVFINENEYKIVAHCDGTDIDVKTGLSFGRNISKLSGPDSVLFKVLGQGTDFNGAIVIEGFGFNRTINISSTGQIK